MSKKPKRDYRTGRITIEQARNRFHEYYDQKAERGKYTTPLGLFRAKLFDMMYTKKDKFLIRCNNTNTYDAKNDINPGECEKGSVKYMLEAGPKTFDAQHVDAFDEGVKFKLENAEGEELGPYESKGATKKLPKIDDAVDAKDIGGPRVNKKKLYVEYFKKQYNARVAEDMTPGGHKGLKAAIPRVHRAPPKGSGNNLVDRYWDNYDKQNEVGELAPNYKRRNKKKSVAEVKLLDFTIGSVDFNATEDLLFDEDDLDIHKTYKLYKKGDKILIQDSRSKLFIESDGNTEYDTQINYLQKLGLILNKEPLVFNEDLEGVILFNLKFKKTNRSKKILLILTLNVTKGELSYDDDEISNENFKNWYTEWLESEGGKPKLLDFWINYGPAEDYESIIVEPIKELQQGGTIHLYGGTEYSSSSDEYSIVSSDEE